MNHLNSQTINSLSHLSDCTTLSVVFHILISYLKEVYFSEVPNAVRLRIIPLWYVANQR